MKVMRQSWMVGRAVPCPPHDVSATLLPLPPRRAEDCPPYLKSRTSLTHYFRNSCRFWLVLAGVAGLAAGSARAANIVALYTFTNTLPGGVDGGTPLAGLIQASNGVLYGTTLNGGSNNGYGTVFKITTNGVFTPLYTFTQTAADGGTPWAGLLQATNGSFYGTTSQGGSNGYGSVFRLTSTGAFTELYGFTRIHGSLYTNAEGGNPTAPLVQGTNGNFYGTGPEGGTNGDGAIFEITAAGALTRLLSFSSNAPAGQNPGALLQSSNGLIYGTTTNGGSNGYGTIFKMTSTGVLTPLYSFTNGVDGAHPGPALTQGANGVLYGTASGGGTNGSGTIFQITTNGVFTPLYSFAPSGQAGLGLATNANGLVPGSLAGGANGIFYGFAQFGGLNGTGNLFQFSTSGGLTVLYTFLVGNLGTGGVTNSFGAEPSGILLDSNGTLYGTARTGGSNGFGTVFEMGLPPQITNQPVSLFLALGSTAKFTAGASVPVCQWQFNGTNIANATNLTLTNLNIQISNAGPYQAVVSNAFGAVTSSVANLNITNVPVAFATGPTALQYGGGQFSVLLTNLTGQGTVVLEASTDLISWTPILTNPPAFGPCPFTDDAAGGWPHRFYRARILPGP
jgi:uncharacterized repeat protein (TIGR03803 family)